MLFLAVGITKLYALVAVGIFNVLHGLLTQVQKFEVFETFKLHGQGADQIVIA